jgi:hypothetical protein
MLRAQHRRPARVTDSAREGRLSSDTVSGRGRVAVGSPKGATRRTRLADPPGFLPPSLSPPRPSQLPLRTTNPAVLALTAESEHDGQPSEGSLDDRTGLRLFHKPPDAAPRYGPRTTRRSSAGSNQLDTVLYGPQIALHKVDLEGDCEQINGARFVTQPRLEAAAHRGRPRARARDCRPRSRRVDEL